MLTVHVFFDCTHRAMPPRTNAMPSQVSMGSQWSSMDVELRVILPFDITLPSAHHSPRTVKRKAREFVIGTVKLSSVSLWLAL